MKRNSSARKTRLHATLAAGLLTALAPGFAEAELLQIIHTNDLHSQLDHADHPGRGGYAAVKGVIDRLRGEATDRGIDTLVVDGGDFLEGSPYYFAGRGAYTFQALETMGYDAVVIGNHDWLMGPGDLNRLLGRVRPSFAFLGANFIATRGQDEIRRHLKPSVELKRAGSRLAVLGLTTDSVMYNWAAGGGFIYNPVWTAHEEVPSLRSRNDFVIALTHLGVKTDKSLIRRTRGIDLVIGGHSHTELHEPRYVRNRDGKPVPIVQAGSWGDVVGDLLVDVTPGKPLEIVRYQLIPVTGDSPRDPLMEAVVAEASDALMEEYGEEWMTTPVARTEVPLTRPGKGSPEWANIVVETLREAGRADVAFDASPFSGKAIAPGPVTPFDILGMYPRMFDFEDRFGWTVWTNRVRGFWLWIALKTVMKMDDVSVGGATARVNGGKVRRIRVGGRRVNWFRNYRVAVPEGIARGASGISDSLRLVLKSPHDTGKPIWLELERKFRELGVVRPGRLP